MSEQRWCATLGRQTAQCAWRRAHGFDRPLPRRIPGKPRPGHVNLARLGDIIPSVVYPTPVNLALLGVGLAFAYIVLVPPKKKGK